MKLFSRPRILNKFGGHVDLYTTVKVHSNGTPVWVVIHSTKDGGYWAVKCNENGEAVVRAGLTNSSSNGHIFKLRAVYPIEELTAGVRMDGWPKAYKRSATYVLRRNDI